MTRNSGTLNNYSCSHALFLPLINEFTWPMEARAFVYLLGMLYCFTGVAIIAEIFMASIEKITTSTRKILVPRSDPSLPPQEIEVPIWNATVANLTLMALGSSASEILLSIIETVGNNFKSGELGPGAIVGAAAFNLLSVTATCIASIPNDESRKIKGLRVFAVNTIFSIMAYLWLIIALVGFSKNVVEIWEAVVTLLLFPIMVFSAYLADKGLPCWNNKGRIGSEGNGKETELGSAHQSNGGGIIVDDFSGAQDVQMNSEELAKWVKQAARTGLTEEDASKLEAYKLGTSMERSRAFYRIGATRALSGRKRAKPPLSGNILIKEANKTRGLTASSKENRLVPAASSKAIVEFKNVACAVPENVGRFPITVIRRGRSDNTVFVKVESIGGNAITGTDFIGVNEVVEFKPNELEKQVTVEILDDTQFEPDEQFYIRLCLIDGAKSQSVDVMLGRIFVMEITILNDDVPGVITFEERSLSLKESADVARVNVIRKTGADGEVTVHWRLIVEKEDSDGKMAKSDTGGILVFMHAETKRTIDLPIPKMMLEKSESFDLELSKPTGGAELGKISRVTVMITNNDDGFNFDGHSDPMVIMSSTNTSSSVSHSVEANDTESWSDQIRNAMNVNGGDLAHATNADYFLHFLTFGWKILFAMVPPVSIWGGWLTFFVSLAVIGILTAFIGDLASIFGCLVGLDDTVTAITFVALGTSLPDLFASRAAAINEKYADNAIGNITGSNSVNVFLGLGLPWMLASVYHARKGKPFVVQAGSLVFSITVFTISATCAMVLLIIRRRSAACGRGELGGPKVTRYISALFLVGLWLNYILLSTLETYGLIRGL